jgi:hypothetical protein
MSVREFGVLDGGSLIIYREDLPLVDAATLHSGRRLDELAQLTGMLTSMRDEPAGRWDHARCPFDRAPAGQRACSIACPHFYVDTEDQTFKLTCGSGDRSIAMLTRRNLEAT